MSSTPPSDSAERVRSLLTLYRASRYDARLPDGRHAVLEVGRAPDPALRPWLGDAPLAAYLTACNPRSSALPAAQNERLLAQLRRELDAAGLRYLDGDGYLPGEQWREPSVLVTGLAPDALDALVRRYAQNAILVVRPGRPVRLRLYRPDWRALTPDAADLEWA